jgi:hypothetical protein
VAFNTALNDMTDAAESTSRPTTFIIWSPCLTNPKTAIALTTVSETSQKSKIAHPPSSVEIFGIIIAVVILADKFVNLLF